MFNDQRNLALFPLNCYHHKIFYHETKREPSLIKQRLLGGRKEALFSKPWHVAHSRSPPPSSCQQYRCSLLAFPHPSLSADLPKSCFSLCQLHFSLQLHSMLKRAVLQPAGLPAKRGPFSTGRAPAGHPSGSVRLRTTAARTAAPGAVDVKHPRLSGRWEMFTN